jgi:hypothetical protein
MLINGKEFEFIRVTVTKQVEIAKKFKMSLIDTVIESGYITRRKKFLDANPNIEITEKELMDLGLIRVDVKANKKAWKKIRSVAFIKTGLWKYLRIIPKELRCSQIQLKQAGELQASFFDYVGAEVKAHDTPLNSAQSTQIENKEAK